MGKKEATSESISYDAPASKKAVVGLLHCIGWSHSIVVWNLDVYESLRLTSIYLGFTLIKHCLVVTSPSSGVILPEFGFLLCNVWL